MRILLKILLPGLLLVLIVAVGAEVVALHRSPLLNPLQTAPVVVRKAAHPTTPPKMVRPVSSAPPASGGARKHPVIAHKKAPAI